VIIRELGHDCEQDPGVIEEGGKGRNGSEDERRDGGFPVRTRHLARKALR
jgi:hypothetical protein